MTFNNKFLQSLISAADIALEGALYSWPLG